MLSAVGVTICMVLCGVLIRYCCTYRLVLISAKRDPYRGGKWTSDVRISKYGL